MAGSALPVTDLGEGNERCWAFCGPEAAGLRMAAAGLVWVQAGLLQTVTVSAAPENPTLILLPLPSVSSPAQLQECVGLQGLCCTQIIGES